MTKNPDHDDDQVTFSKTSREGLSQIMKTVRGEGRKKIVQIEIGKRQTGHNESRVATAAAGPFQPPITGTSSAAILGQTLALLRKVRT